jgi:hypothetical protein
MHRNTDYSYIAKLQSTPACLLSHHAWTFSTKMIFISTFVAHHSHFIYQFIFSA